MKLLRGVCVLSFVTCLAAPIGAQSAYVPLDDVAYAYVDALIARGELRSLSLLGRPYTVEAIRRALAAADAGRGRLSDAARGEGSHRAASSHLRRRLDRALARHEQPARRRRDFRAHLSGSVWATGETSGQRELMLADDNTPRAYLGGDLRFAMGGDQFLAVIRPVLENRLNSDPEFQGMKDRSVAGRLEEGYVAGQWRFAELFFGRASRNWGPASPGAGGLLLSSWPYSYDHLYARLGIPRLNGEFVVARLDDDIDVSGARVQRYLAAHRLNVRWRGLEGSFGESILYTGVGRGLEFSLLNPVSPYALAWRSERVDGNLMLDGQLAARTRFGVFTGELLIDDLQIDRCAAEEIGLAGPQACEPASYGLTLTGEGLPLFANHRAFGLYTRVSSLAYRTPVRAEEYSVQGSGLGRGASDYDEWRAGIDLDLRGAPLRAYVARRRQGSGDFRLPFPEQEQYPNHPGIFEPPVTRTVRVALAGGIAFKSLDVLGDLGYNRVRSDAAGTASSGEFEGRVRVKWSPGWAAARVVP